MKTWMILASLVAVTGSIKPVFAQAGSFSDLDVNGSLRVTGTNATGIYSRVNFGVATPLNNTQAQGLFLWDGGRRSLYAGYFLNTHINTFPSRQYSLGIGFNARPTGNYAAAFGSDTSAGSYAAAFGSGTSAFAYSLAGGWNTAASGEASVALGRNSSAVGSQSFAAGLNTQAFGNFSVAFGTGSEAEGTASFAAGNNTLASGVNTAAFGGNTEATAGGAFAAGWYSKATANDAVAFNAWTTASGQRSSAFGHQTIASHAETFVVGLFNNALGGIPYASRPLFVVGNGVNTSNRANALEVRANGDVIIKRIPPKGGISMGNFQ